MKDSNVVSSYDGATDGFLELVNEMIKDFTMYR